jgi:nitrate/nitrite transporter NarK
MKHKTDQAFCLFGRWFTFVASLTLICTHNKASLILLSILVVVCMMPNTMFGLLGGMLADRFDQKASMIILDGSAGCVALLFLLYPSIMTLLDSSVHGHSKNPIWFLPAKLISHFTLPVAGASSTTPRSHYQICHQSQLFE